MDMTEFNDFLPIKFMIVMSKMNAVIVGKVENYIKDLGFNKTEFLIMYSIAAHGKLTIQDIGVRITMTSGNMTYTIDKLEKRDIIRRVRCPKDRRKIYIDFTEIGKKQWSVVMDKHMIHMEEVFESIDDEVIRETIEYMKIVGKGLDKK
ncbi:MAG: MarR family transcriptional regulator [Clostridiales bacterium]